MRYTHKPKAFAERRLLHFSKKTPQERMAAKRAQERAEQKANVPEEFRDKLQIVEDDLDYYIDKAKKILDARAKKLNRPDMAPKFDRKTGMVLRFRAKGELSKDDEVARGLINDLWRLQQIKRDLYKAPEISFLGYEGAHSTPVYQKETEAWAKHVQNMEDNVDAGKEGAASDIENYDIGDNWDTRPDSADINSAVKLNKHASEKRKDTVESLFAGYNSASSTQSPEELSKLLAKIEEVEKANAEEAEHRLRYGVVSGEEKEYTRSVVSKERIQQIDGSISSTLERKSTLARKDLKILKPNGAVNKDSINDTKESLRPELEYRTARKEQPHMDGNRLAEAQRQDTELGGLEAKTVANIQEVLDAKKKIETITKNNPLTKGEVKTLTDLPKEVDEGPRKFFKDYGVEDENPAIVAIDTSSDLAKDSIAKDSFLNAEKTLNDLATHVRQHSEDKLLDGYETTDESAYRAGLAEHEAAAKRALTSVNSTGREVTDVDLSRRKGEKLKELTDRKNNLVSRLVTAQDIIKTEILEGIDHIRTLKDIETDTLVRATETQGVFDDNLSNLWDPAMTVERLEDSKVYREDRLAELAVAKEQIAETDNSRRPETSAKGVELDEKIDDQIALIKGQNVEIDDAIVWRGAEDVIEGADNFSTQAGNLISRIESSIANTDELDPAAMQTLKDSTALEVIDNEARMTDEITKLNDEKRKLEARLGVNPEGLSTEKIERRIRNIEEGIRQIEEAKTNLRGQQDRIVELERSIVVPAVPPMPSEGVIPNVDAPNPSIPSDPGAPQNPMDSEFGSAEGLV